jgi:taurine transport system substrate-binding protein
VPDDGSRSLPVRRDVLALGAGGIAAAFAGRSAHAQSAQKPDVVRFGILTAARAWTIGKTDGSFEKALGTKVE